MNHPLVVQVRAVHWLTGGGFGVVAVDLSGEFVTHRSIVDRRRVFLSASSASRASLGLPPFGWSRDVVAFRAVPGGGAGGCFGGRLAGRVRGSVLEDSSSNTVRFVPIWDSDPVLLQVPSVSSGPRES